ncbi:MAG TPA: cysteine hydrolase family protein [Rhizomicrobium sp.]|nr:cysteine hydrolase family protein [Rhizomicrobium sp.]
MKKALVVIDVQKGMFADPSSPPLDGEGVVGRIAGLIARARAQGAPVFFVQHDEGPDHPFHPGNPGFPIHDRLAPRPGDDVTVKTKSSAFHGTDFEARLKRAGVDHLVITGMQSEYCVNSTLRGAYERGYGITLASDGHSTFDSKFASARLIADIQNDTVNGSFGEAVPAAEISFA